MVLLDRKVNHSRTNNNNNLDTRYQDHYKIDSQNSNGRGPTDISDVGDYLDGTQIAF